MANGKSLTITVFNFGTADSIIYLTEVRFASGYLESVTGFGGIPGADSTVFVLQPTQDAEDAGPVGGLVFLLGDSDGEVLTVKFVWEDTNKPGATVITNQIPGFNVEITDNNLNDPNTPSCSVILKLA